MAGRGRNSRQARRHRFSLRRRRPAGHARYLGGPKRTAARVIVFGLWLLLALALTATLYALMKGPA